MSKRPAPPPKGPPVFGWVDDPTQPWGMYEPIPCKIRNKGLVTGCTVCGLQWSTVDPQVPQCPRWAVTRGRIKVPGCPSSSPPPSPLLAGSPWQVRVAIIILAILAVYSWHQEIIGWFR